MQRRPYRLGRRQAAVDGTRAAILNAARDLIADGGEPSVGAVARRAGCSRITVYNRFGSKAELLRAVAAEAGREAAGRSGVIALKDERDELLVRITSGCFRWGSDPALFRGLPAAATAGAEPAGAYRNLAERLAASGRLRPGCSIKEAEDVFEALSSFTTFDHLHRDGRRSPSAVAGILMRLAAGVLAYA